MDAFKINANYSLIFKDVEKALVPSQIKIKDNFKDLVSTENIHIDDYKYYEYVQFKKAVFKSDSSSLKYDNVTGRITQMVFNFDKIR